MSIKNLKQYFFNKVTSDILEPSGTMLHIIHNTYGFVYNIGHYTNLCPIF